MILGKMLRIVVAVAVLLLSIVVSLIAQATALRLLEP